MENWFRILFSGLEIIEGSNFDNLRASSSQTIYSLLRCRVRIRYDFYVDGWHLLSGGGCFGRFRFLRLQRHHLLCGGNLARRRCHFQGRLDHDGVRSDVCYGRFGFDVFS